MEDRDLGPEEWDIEDDGLKEKVDARSIDVPCGRAEFDEREATSLVQIDDNGYVYVTVDAECQACGHRFTWSGGLGGPNTPDCSSLGWSIVRDDADDAEVSVS